MGKSPDAFIITPQPFIQSLCPTRPGAARGVLGQCGFLHR
ncbi:hypothetical protein BN137_1109 [Cronobacter condimenti 1330]|uniref:Uncharacterized protein n=1 Tax=Cronobacter condimenti 1330 TaxID=1073999 RepID=K7ZYP8_9ENTR|nr:hypothetical protein BN137_1109 [Cronobacter condimenti 1330]